MQQPSAGDSSVAREFARRVRALRWGMGIVLATFATATVSMATLPAPWPTVLGFTAMVLTIPLAVIWYRYRCPACGAVPVDGEGQPTLNRPSRCHACGVSLQ